ncbi:MAG: tetratricopeptide repeat protein, partial [Acidobacteriota bacterium]
MILLFLMMTFLPQSPRATLPPVPEIVVSSYGEETRKQISTALEGVRRQPRDAAANGRLAMILHAYEEYEAAEVCYRRARQLERDLRWVYLHGLIETQLGRHAEAVATFSEAVRIDPSWWPARLRMAESLYPLGRFSESRRGLEDLAREHADLSLIHYDLGLTLSALREFGRAAESFRRAVELSPYFGSAHYGLAMALRELDRRDEAVGHLRLSQQYKLIRPFLSDRIEQEMRAFNLGAAAHLRRGVELDAAGRIDEAIAEHEKALAINPRFEQVRLNLLTLYARAGRVEKAEEQYRAIMELNPNLAESHYNYGVMKAESRDFPNAGEAFQRCLKINPYHPQAHFNLGRLREIEQSYDAALDHYRRAVELEPSYREARFELARMQIYKGRLAEAIVTLENALRPVDAQTPRLTYALAIACARHGERERALRLMVEARQQA